MIEIKGLKKSFGSLEVLKGIDLSVSKGEVLSIIGPSGTGKSTLLRCLNYLEIPDEGSMKIDDLKITGGKHPSKEIYEFRRKSAMIFQNFCLFNNKTALENIKLALKVVQKKDSATVRKEALALLEQVGLSEKKDAYPSTLSGGQQQRVAIARALALRPKVLMFDEPTSALDPYLVADVLDVIRDVANTHNTTMLIVTHEMHFARDISDRIAFMDHGFIEQLGTPEEIFSSSDENVRKFVGRMSH
ncbi:MAG: amino acid ABC transporter ATP-binding protein [Mogibacterium sp.]|nr:amino acid ABC transporter ATP-binding protein [Mogibacterium sp.]